jgi:chemotaxis protein methyltransferase CheR
MAADPVLTAADYKAIASLLYEWTGIRLQNKRQLVIGRLTPRLRALRLSTFSEYVELVMHQGAKGVEAQAFINQLTTNKTAFFREPHHFDYLRAFLTQTVAPRALSRGERKVRLWSAACSTGEEAYSLAITAAEALPSSAGWDVRVRATDIDTNCLDVGRAGVYDHERFEEVPIALRERCFSKLPDGQYRVLPEIARLVSFEQLNLVREPSFGRDTFDAIFCRNVIIYFDSATQKALIERLVQRLAPDGRLYLGHSETLVGSSLVRVSDQIGVYAQGAAAQRQAEPVPANAAAAARVGRRSVPPTSRRPIRMVQPPAARIVRPPPLPPSQNLTESGASVDQPLPHLRVVLGEWQVATTPTIVSTLLGSCVSACLFDEQAGVGGMNHFMLPSSSGSDASPANFGVHAMELLINALMMRGAVRSRLRAKVFGAGAVTKALPATVGEANAQFIRSFLAREGIPLVVERLGGERPREVFFRTDTGEVRLRAISPQKARALEERELNAWKKPTPQESAFDADDALF